ncbi:MAG: ABC transporter ATP-binding protein [Candidatus Lokiarchaeota archaeon]|nr:ABC transporter ATP-binding protein [Candidatus Lokiarchaeota archaeon]
MKDPIIQTFSLTKAFKDVIAVKNLNLKVSRGIYGLLGLNGAGKTTTIKMMVGSLFPTQGSIEIFGQNIHRNAKMDIHKRIGYVPEHPTYFLSMTAEKLLTYIGSVFQMSIQEIKRRITELLRLVELTDAKSRIIAKYSAGMKQRIGIAQALMNDPELLILDEITSNLDPIGRNQMIELLKDLKKQGKTIFISTHVLPEIQKMNADSIAIIDHGHLIMEGTVDKLNEELKTKEIVISPNHKLLREALFSVVSNIKEEEDTLVVNTDKLDEVWQLIAKVALQNNILIKEFRSTFLNIEQIFMKALNSKQIEGIEK